jgi:hypothetical protein
MQLARIAAAASVTLAGVVGALAPLQFLLGGTDSLFGLALAVLGIVLGIVVALAGVLLYRSSIGDRGVLRVAGWHLLGVVVLGLILALVELYAPGSLPPFAAADIILVSAFAHLLIGYNDVRQIRAGKLADRTQRLDVLSQVLRHNLRTEAQVLVGYADLVANAETLEQAREHAATLEERTEGLAALHERVGEVYWAMEFDPAETQPIGVTETLETVRDLFDERADISVATSAAPELSVDAGDRLQDAIRYVIEEAIETSDVDRPTVELAAVGSEHGRVAITVTSPDGTIPEMERLLVQEGTTITQTNHSRDIRLWVAKWIAGAYGGSLSVDEVATGSRVRFDLPAV